MESVYGQACQKDVSLDECVMSAIMPTNRVSTTLTFGAPDPHDRFESDLSGEVTLKIFLELLCLRWIVLVMEGRVVEDSAGRVFGHARCTREGNKSVTP